MEPGWSLPWADMYGTLVIASRNRWLSIPKLIFCKQVAEVPRPQAISNFRVEPGAKTIRKVSQWARLAPGWLRLFSSIPPKQPASPSITILAAAVSLLVYFQ